MSVGATVAAYAGCRADGLVARRGVSRTASVVFGGAGGVLGGVLASTGLKVSAWRLDIRGVGGILVIVVIRVVFTHRRHVFTVCAVWPAPCRASPSSAVTHCA